MNANELADDLDNANGFQYLAQLGLASQAATMLRQQQAEIEALKKFNKAILKKGGCDGNICQQYSTHPVKELTDEEILDISDNFCLDDGVSTLYEFTASGLIDFARAILRKASEK